MNRGFSMIWRDFLPSTKPFFALSLFRRVFLNSVSMISVRRELQRPALKKKKPVGCRRLWN
jgi:hypothetical protein